MSLKAKLEAIVYAAETPVTLDQLVQVVKESVVAENGSTDDAEVKSLPWMNWWPNTAPPNTESKFGK